MGGGAKRFLALDVGERRIGIAYGDSDVKITTPWGALTNDDSLIAELKGLIKQFRIDQLVIGMPRNSRGELTKQSQYVTNFSQKLASLGLPISYQDESLTSVQAEERLGRNRNIFDKSAVDAEAAAIFLTDYLEANFGKK